MNVPKIQQIKYISHFLKPKEKLTIRMFWLIILFSSFFLGLRFYFVYLKILPAKGGEYSEALVGNPKYVNPVLAPINEADLDIVKLIFSGLLRYDKNQKLIPDLAASYQISVDQKTYTFFLKRNVKWHDEKDFSADDVVFTIETIQNPEFKSPLYSSFKGVNCEKINDYQVKFTLNEPYSPFPSLLILGIIPKHVWQDFTPAQFHLAEYNLKPIGSGPFKFKSLIKDKRGVIKNYILKRNDNFYRQPPYLDKISFKIQSDQQEALDAFKSKIVDALGLMGGNLKEIKLKNFNYFPLRIPQYTAIFLNQTSNAFLKEKKLRQSLTYAVDREKIVKEVLDDKGEIINGPLLPSSLGYNPEIKKHDYNLDKANQLLNELGWSLVKATTTEQNLEKEVLTRKKGVEELKIVLTTVEREENVKTAEIIKEGFEKLGIKTEVKFIPGQTIMKEIIKPRNYEALLYGVILGYETDPYLLWHSSQISEFGLNLANFADKEVDLVLEEARKISDYNARHLKYQHFQNIILEQAPAIFLYSPFYNYLIDKKIKGVDLKNIALPSERFANAEEWYIKTKKGFEK